VEPSSSSRYPRRTSAPRARENDAEPRHRHKASMPTQGTSQAQSGAHAYEKAPRPHPP